MSYNLTPNHLRSLGFDVAEKEGDEDEGPGYELISEEPIDIEETDIDEYERENKMYGEYDYTPEDVESGFDDAEQGIRYPEPTSTVSVNYLESLDIDNLEDLETARIVHQAYADKYKVHGRGR